MRLRRGWLLKLGIGVTLLLGPAACMQNPAAMPIMQLEPIQVGPPGSGVLGPVAFMAGCWRGPISEGRGSYEERFTPPAAGVMLGTSRMWEGDRLFSFEYLTVQGDANGIVLRPAPQGVQAGVEFALSESEPGLAVFSAPEHDYPRRIIYRIDDSGDLRIRIDAGSEDSDPSSWILTPVDCLV